MDTKICVTCKQEKALEFFSRSKARADGRNSACKDCYNKYKKDYYLKNQKKIKRTNGKRRKEMQEWLKAYRATLQCEKCGFSHPGVMDFHHNGKKDFNIGEAVKYGYSKEKILEEIASCSVLCCRCHRILHWEERNT